MILWVFLDSSLLNHYQEICISILGDGFNFEIALFHMVAYFVQFI